MQNVDLWYHTTSIPFLGSECWADSRKLDWWTGSMAECGKMWSNSTNVRGRKCSMVRAETGYESK